MKNTTQTIGTFTRTKKILSYVEKIKKGIYPKLANVYNIENYQVFTDAYLLVAFVPEDRIDSLITKEPIYSNFSNIINSYKQKDIIELITINYAALKTAKKSKEKLIKVSNNLETHATFDPVLLLDLCTMLGINKNFEIQLKKDVAFIQLESGSFGFLLSILYRGAKDLINIAL